MKIITSHLILTSNFNDKAVNQIAELLSVPATAAVNILLPVDRVTRLLAIKHLIANNHCLTINKQVDDRVIGMIMLSAFYGKEGEKLAHHYEIGYLIAESDRNRGYMTEAIRGMVTCLPLSTVLHAVTQKKNIQSQRVLEKCGFKKMTNGQWLWENLHFNSSKV